MGPSVEARAARADRPAACFCRRDPGACNLQPPPAYPDEAKRSACRAWRRCTTSISKEGTVKDVQVISGPPPLLVSAIDAVRQWKYRPYLIDGEPTEVDTTININYTLEAPPAAPSPAQSSEPPSATAPATHLKGPGGEDVAVLHANVSDAGMPDIRSIEYKGLNSVTLQDVVERFRRDGIGLSLEILVRCSADHASGSFPEAVAGRAWSSRTRSSP